MSRAMIRSIGSVAVALSLFGMPRKIRFRSGKDAPTKLKIEVLFTAFGRPLNISAPPPAETTPIEEVAE